MTSASPTRAAFVRASAATAATVAARPAGAQENLGVVGVIKPTMRPGSLEEMIRLLPAGVGVIPIYLDIREGTQAEFETVIPAYERGIAALAKQHCDMIHPEGAPPFMVQGYKAETALVAGWEQKYKVPIFTAPQNQVNALRALHVKSILGATYFPGEINAVYAKYFKDAGFTVTSLTGLEGVPFNKVQDVPSSDIYAYIKRNFLAHPADAIYMLGSGWRTIDIIEPLEQDLQVPVIHPIAARVWEIQKRLHLRRPIRGRGQLLTLLP